MVVTLTTIYVTHLSPMNIQFMKKCQLTCPQKHDEEEKWDHWPIPGLGTLFHSYRCAKHCALCFEKNLLFL